MTSMLIFGLWIWKVALRILGPCASHLVNAPCAVYDIIRATPWVCGALSSSWPEHSSESPEASLLWPEPVHLVPLIPLTGTCPPCLADFKVCEIVITHFCGNLCFKHGLDVPCSESNGAPGSDDGHRLMGFRMIPTFSPKLHSVSSQRSFFSQGWVVFKFVEGVSANTFRCYTNGLLTHCITPNLED